MEFYRLNGNAHRQIHIQFTICCFKSNIKPHKDTNLPYKFFLLVFKRKDTAINRKIL